MTDITAIAGRTGALIEEPTDAPSAVTTVTVMIGVMAAAMVDGEVGAGLGEETPARTRSAAIRTGATAIVPGGIVAVRSLSHRRAGLEVQQLLAGFRS